MCRGEGDKLLSLFLDLDCPAVLSSSINQSVASGLMETAESSKGRAATQSSAEGFTRTRKMGRTARDASVCRLLYMSLDTGGPERSCPSKDKKKMQGDLQACQPKTRRCVCADVSVDGLQLRTR